MSLGTDEEDDDKDYEVGSDPELNPPSTNPSAPGEPELEINGYQLIGELNRGGQAAIFLAVQKSTGRKVALKMMFGGSFASEMDRQRMDQEVRILAALDHPNIISVMDRGETADGSHYFVMNYVDGRALSEFLDDYRRDHGSPAQATDVSDLLKLFKRICEAVNAAHLRGIVHRDLKPANIVIDAYGEPHILDFGLAHAALAQGSEPGKATTRPGEFVGSIEWASPEQARGAADQIDTRTDVYALGVILYEMLTGEFPYEVFGELRDVLDNIVQDRPAPPSAILQAERKKTNSTTRPAVDARLDAILLKALAKNREARFQTAGEFAREIGHYLEAPRGIPAGPMRRLWPLSLLVISGALALSVAAFFMMEKLKQPAPTLQVNYEYGIYGYAETDAEIYFIFEPNRYELARHQDSRLLRLDQAGPLNRVSVTGAFNEWQRDPAGWIMKQTGPDRFELRKPLSDFAGKSEWPFKFLVNGELWVGAPAQAANREVAVADTATFNLLLVTSKDASAEGTKALHGYRERIQAAWPGQAANLARDEQGLYHFTFSHLSPGLRITDLEPLRGLPLASLDLGEAKVTDLSPLANMTSLQNLRVSDGSFQALTTDLIAALRRHDFTTADRAAQDLFLNLSEVPALTAARQLIMEGAQNLRQANDQPGTPLPHLHIFQGHRYAFIVNPMAWPNARDFAASLGGHLPSVTSKEENDWLARTFGLACLGRNLWLGGTDEGTESYWRWHNGEGWRYEHWTAPEPNNNGGSENVAALKPDGWWMDADGHSLHLPFVVEWDSEPGIHPR